MLIKIYGGLDILSGIILLLASFDIGGWRLPFFAAIYLLVKSLAYWGGFASFMDFVVGAYLIIVLFIGNIIIGILGAAYLVYKGIRCFI